MKTALEFDIVHLTFDGIKVFVNEEVSCLVRELGRRLPKERCHIIIDRTSATTLEVNEIWFSILQHDVARLEVTIEEGVLLVIKQIISQALEVLLELVLVELDTLELEEAVLEIVEVEHDAWARTGNVAIHGWSLSKPPSPQHPMYHLPDDAAP